MYLIVALSVYTLAILFYKAYQFVNAHVYNTRFIDPVMLFVKRGEMTDASKLLEKERGPVARIMRVSVDCIMNRDMSVKSREAEIARVGAGELRYLESHMRSLEVVSTIAPLLGLMGTVIGMIASFSKLSQAGSRIDPSMLAGGIWEALITTVGGLLVAVPALAAYYVIDAQIERVRAIMRDVTVQILALEDSFIKNEKEQEKREAIELENARRRLMEDQQKAAAMMAAAVANSNAQQTAQRIDREKTEKEKKKREQMELLAEKTAETATSRGAPQSASVLRLLSPSYNKF
ncbi:MAG: MotA/TolQ/ExbB proton channel family protein [Alphaproteobacteria bacterium]|nr:MotA/TolQ/ExbB proton channel family protein [Alphaproteobacteria bacterium]